MNIRTLYVACELSSLAATNFLFFFKKNDQCMFFFSRKVLEKRLKFPMMAIAHVSVVAI